MRRSNSFARRIAEESGSAALEFLGAGVVLLVPLFFLVATLGMLQGAAMATAASAREGVRALAEGADEESLMSVIGTSLADYGIAPEGVTARVGCRGNDPGCPEAGTVSITVSTDVSIPLVPSIFGLDRMLVIPVSSTARQALDRFGAS